MHIIRFGLVIWYPHWTSHLLLSNPNPQLIIFLLKPHHLAHHGLHLDTLLIEFRFEHASQAHSLLPPPPLLLQLLIEYPELMLELSLPLLAHHHHILDLFELVVEVGGEGLRLDAHLGQSSGEVVVDVLDSGEAAH